MTRFLLCAVVSHALLMAQDTPPRPSAPLPGRTQNASAPSHVYTRGDVEILTFETEQDYDRLTLLPDYVRVKDGRVVSGGHFDSDWKLAAK